MSTVRADPVCTYRVQLRPEFGFDDASAIVDYLAELGISHLYCSPYLQAAPGSAHGYDVVDHTSINAELGGPEAHARLGAALDEAGLGQVLDLVPNHMAVSPRNRWWVDVLEDGPASRHAGYFDIDWDPPERKLRNRILIPTLGDHYGRVLEAGEIGLVRDGGSLSVTYFEHRWPVAPPTYEVVLGPAAAATGDDELAFLAGAFASLPPATAVDRELQVVRHRDKGVLKRRLHELCAARPDLAAAVDRAVAEVAADVDRLDALLDRQNFRLAHWRTASEELDYRRFFDVTDLVALRTERPWVFDDVHRVPLELVAEGVLDGLRIDHPDGLADPKGYLDRLRAAAPGVWLVVEKILEPGEELPDDWDVDGTTGYDFLNRCLGLFVDPEGEAPLSDAYVRFTGASVDWEEAALEGKRTVLDGSLAADVRRLTNLLVEVCEGERRVRDFTRWDLRAALVETIASFPVYRTYVRPGHPVGARDGAVIEAALDDVRVRRSDIDPELLDLVRRAVRGELSGPGVELCVRFQQTTSPVMAKGVEDTAFYRYNRLAALCEVGGDPSRFGVAPAVFHGWMAEADRRWPRAMLAGSTHDTKRSEDVRARLALLSEIPDDFGAAVERWAAMRPDLATGDRNLEWLLYQTFVGAWPLPAERAVEFARKAAREAKRSTSWSEPSEPFEASLSGFVEGLIEDRTFVADLEAFVAPLVAPGRVNSLAMHVVRLLAPGVPDVYQGTELWDLSLVDPDNRRPVDYERRRRLLRELDGLSAEEIWARADDGLPKLHVTRQALCVRRAGLGAYEPLVADDHALAFLRGPGVAAVVPRLPLRLARDGGWGDRQVRLPPGRWRNVLTDVEVEGGEIAIGRLLDAFPVAVLVR